MKNVKIDQLLHDRIKIYCAKEKIKIHQAVEDAIKLFLKQKWKDKRSK